MSLVPMEGMTWKALPFAASTNPVFEMYVVPQQANILRNIADALLDAMYFLPLNAML